MYFQRNILQLKCDKINKPECFYFPNMSSIFPQFPVLISSLMTFLCLFLDFLFPKGSRQQDMKVCDKFQIKAFCKDGVEPAETMFILATISCLLIILSLVHYLMCLSANYAHIRDHEKFQELQEIQNLNDMEYSAASKERF